jgi:histidine triad (HIT) family protein
MASIFTQIINREIPSTIMFENDKIIVIKNIHPEAKTHLLIIPKKEIPTINDLQAEDPELILELFSTAKKVAAEIGVIEGYKLYFNV